MHPILVCSDNADETFIMVMKAEALCIHQNTYLWVPYKPEGDFFTFILSAGVLQGKNLFRSKQLFLV